jgi:hypothetical protein
MLRMTALILFVVAACGNIHRREPDDAGLSEPPPDVIDAMIDAMPDAALLHEAREFVTGGVRMSGPTYTFDVQVGHSVQQGNVAGPTYQLETNAAVKP